MRANKMHDWVHFHDRVTNEVNSNQTYELMAYLPYSMIPWHTEFALHANSSSECIARINRTDAYRS